MAASLRGLEPAARAAAEYCLAIAAAYDVPVTVTSAYRSWAEQTQLRDHYERCVARGAYPQGDGCHYPANRPGDSAHNYGLAWDSVVPEWAQTWWTAVRRWVGWEVLDHDIIHAQVPAWRDLVS